MTPKDAVKRMLSTINNIRKNLNDSLIEMDEIYKKIPYALEVNNQVFYRSLVQQNKNDILAQIRIIDNDIIPEIEKTLASF